MLRVIVLVVGLLNEALHELPLRQSLLELVHTWLLLTIGLLSVRLVSWLLPIRLLPIGLLSIRLLSIRL